MIGILVVTHGELSQSLLKTAQMFVSDTEAVVSVSFTEGQGVEDLRDSVLSKLKELESCTTVLGLADIPGGSPARVMSEMVLENPQVELITGVNLPMLVEAILSRTFMERKELVNHLIDSSRNSIIDLSSMLRTI